MARDNLLRFAQFRGQGGSYATKPAVISVTSNKLPIPEPTDRLSVLRRKFRKQPEPEESKEPYILFCDDTYQFATPVMAEIYVSHLLNRDEFRAHCNRYQTKDQILANLK